MLMKPAGAILVADMHFIGRTGLASVFSRCLDMKEIHEAASFSVVEQTLEANPQILLVLIDLKLPGLDGPSGLRHLRLHFPLIKLIAVADMAERATILEVLAAGVHGYLPKTLEMLEMAAAFQSVLSGQIFVPPLLSDLPDTPFGFLFKAEHTIKHPLTSRQIEVLDLLVAGQSNKLIARRLNIAESTVKVHVNASFRVLGVHNRTSAIAAMRRSTGKAENDDHETPTVLSTVIDVVQRSQIALAAGLTCLQSLFYDAQAFI